MSDSRATIQAVVSSAGAHWEVDDSERSCLVICKDCGARFIYALREPAMQALSDHLRRAHSAYRAAEDAARESTLTGRNASRPRRRP